MKVGSNKNGSKKNGISSGASYAGSHPPDAAAGRSLQARPAVAIRSIAAGEVTGDV